MIPTDVGAPPPSAEVQPPQRRGRSKRLLIGVLAVVGVVFATLVAVGLATQGVRSKVLLSANFDNGVGPLSTDNDPTIAMQFTDGGYQMLLKQPNSQIARAWFPGGTVRGVRIEVTATIRACPGSCIIGVGVWNGTRSDYTLAYSPSAGAAILRQPDATTRSTQLLTESPVATTDHVHFVFEVRGGGTKPTSLAGWVNGHELRVSDTAGYDSFGAVSLLVAGNRAPVDVLWDNLKATRL